MFVQIILVITKKKHTKLSSRKEKRLFVVENLTGRGAFDVEKKFSFSIVRKFGGSLLSRGTVCGETFIFSQWRKEPENTQ